MRALTPFPHAAPASLAEVTDNCVALLVAQGGASAPTPELRREVELHLWLDHLCDEPPAAREAPNRTPLRHRARVSHEKH